MIRNYRDLEVWQRSRRLVKTIYLLTETFPKSQQFVLTQQMQRAALSIPSNIAEGQAKRATRDYIRHVNIACGSLAELDTQLLLACDLGFANATATAPTEEECAIIGRMLNKLVSSLEASLERRKNVSPEPRSLEPEPL